MKTKQTIHILHHGFRQPYFSFAPDRNSFAILDREGILQIWDPATGRKVSQFSHRIEQNYSYLGFSPSGKFLLTHGYDSAFIWDIEEGTTVAELIDFRGYILGVGFTPDEKSVIISASLKGTTGFINRWYLDQWRFEEKITQCLKEKIIYEPLPYKVIFTSDCQNCIALFEEKAEVWQLKFDGSEMTHLYNYQHNGEDILGVAFSPDEKKVVTTSKDVRVWNFSLLSDPTSMNDSRDANICIQFSGDRKYLITTNGGSIKLWDVVNEKPQKKIFIHEDLTLVTTFSEDISKVATAIWEEWRSLYIYDIEKDQEIFLRWDGYALSDTKIIFSPDARFLAITHYVDVSVYIYDIDQRKKIIGLKGTGQATAIVFSPDGQRIAISFASGEVKVWDTLHYNQLFLLRDHLQVQEDEGVGIESLSVSSDSSLIALGATNYAGRTCQDRN